MKVKINNLTVASQYPPFSTSTPPTLIEDTKTSDCSDPSINRLIFTYALRSILLMGLRGRHRVLLYNSD